MKIENRFSPQLSKIQVSGIRQFDDKVAEIPNIIKLTLGEPDFYTPSHIKSSGIQAIEENFTHYTSMSGIEDLRTAVAYFQKEKYGLSYNPENEILVTVGATEAIAASLLAILEEGDKVLLPAPIYSGYEPLVTLAGAENIFIDTSKTNFKLTPRLIQEVMKAHGESVKAIILNYPSNPTGVTYSKEEVESLAKELGKYPIFVLSDEIYAELTYEAKHISIANYLPEQTILITGLSKSHAMTGWRIGFILTNAVICDQIKKVHQYLVTAASTISQKAAVTALVDGFHDADTMREEYQKRRDFVFEQMIKAGFEVTLPSGAFYVFAKIPAYFEENSFDFCLRLAQEKQVALIPGSAFGEAGEGYVRISYAASMENLQTAMKRINEFTSH